MPSNWAQATSLSSAGTIHLPTSKLRGWLLSRSMGELLQFNQYEPLLQGFGEGTYVEAMIALDDGGFAISGYAAPGLGEAFLWRFDANAHSVWSRLYGALGFRSATDVVQTTNGGFALTGCDLPNCNDVVILRTDADGEPLWVTELDGSDSDGRSVTEMNNGHLSVAERSEIG